MSHVPMNEGFNEQDNGMSEIYGCLHKTDVIIVPIHRVSFGDVGKVIRSWLEVLQSPCSTISVFNRNRMIDWNTNYGGQNIFDTNDLMGDIFFQEQHAYVVELVQFIGSLHGQYPGNAPNNRKVLLLTNIYGPYLKVSIVIEALDLLHSSTDWIVIIACKPDLCPISLIPINRLVAESYNSYKLVEENVRALIRNPDFNPFLVWIHHTIDEAKIKCFEDKTIYVNLRKTDLKMMKEFVILIQNIKTTRFFVYCDDNNEIKYWKSLLRESGMKDQQRLSIETTYTQRRRLIYFKTSSSKNKEIYFHQISDFDNAELNYIQKQLCSDTSTQKRHVIYSEYNENELWFNGNIKIPGCDGKVEIRPFSIDRERPSRHSDYIEAILNEICPERG